MLDLEAANLELFQAITGRYGALGRSLRPRLTVHALGEQIAPHRRVRGHGRITLLASHAQIVQVQLRRPARMFAILQRQQANSHRRQTREAALVAAQAVLECGHRIARAPGPVVPALDGRRAEAHVQARDGVAPGLGSQAKKGGTQLPGRGRGGHQRADDGEAQARPSITFRGIGNFVQCRLQMRPHRRCDSTGAKARQLRRAWLRASSADDQPASFSVIAAGRPRPTVTGLSQTSRCTSASGSRPVNRVINSPGS